MNAQLAAWQCIVLAAVLVLIILLPLAHRLGQRPQKRAKKARRLMAVTEKRIERAATPASSDAMHASSNNRPHAFPAI